MNTPSPIRIALCTDTHLWPGSENFVTNTGGIQLQAASDQLLHSLVDSIRTTSPDLVIHLGDWTCGGGAFTMTHEQFRQTLRQAQAAFRQLPAPLYALPGNHDCPPGGGNWGFFARLWEGTPGIGYTVDLPMARLVLVNTQGHSPDQIAAAQPGDPIYGWVNQAELARVEDALSTAQDLPVLLFMHQLLKPWQGAAGWREIYGIQNATSVLELMMRYQTVRAVFQGHAHRLDVQRVQVGAMDCTFVVAPAVIEYPVGWLLLSLEPGCLQMRLQKLPLFDLAETSRSSGEGQTWREGRREWQDLRIEF